VSSAATERPVAESGEVSPALRLHGPTAGCRIREKKMAAKGGWLERMSKAATQWTGTSAAFALALGTVVVWALTGPYFDYSPTWQLVINTGTTIVTFLMVFLIQRAQNKDSAAIHLKLNELVAALPGSSNRLISAEELTEDEVRLLREHFRKLVELAKQDEDFTTAHSIEEAEAEHTRKKASREAERPEKVLERKRRKRRAKPAADDNGQPEANKPASSSSLEQ
jgi:low affinity Fe/Cu permease